MSRLLGRVTTRSCARSQRFTAWPAQQRVRSVVDCRHRPWPQQGVIPGSASAAPLWRGSGGRAMGVTGTAAIEMSLKPRQGDPRAIPGPECPPTRRWVGAAPFPRPRASSLLQPPAPLPGLGDTAETGVRFTAPPVGYIPAKAQHTDGVDSIWDDWNDAVNMSATELEKWLQTEDSQSVGDKKGGDESVGHQSGRRIVEILGKKKAEGGVDRRRHGMDAESGRLRAPPPGAGPVIRRRTLPLALLADELGKRPAQELTIASVGPPSGSAGQVGEP